MLVNLHSLALIGCVLLQTAKAIEPCSGTSSLPCSCPYGTTYAESGTYVIVGAGAPDFAAVVTDFFNTTWMGGLPYATTGTNNKVGATRSFTQYTTKGPYNFTEKLTQYSVASNGAFQIKYEQAKPVRFADGSGSMAGYWVTFQSDYVFPDQAPSGWSSYSCQTGHPLDFIGFRSYAYNNSNTILKQKGQSKRTFI